MATPGATAAPDEADPFGTAAAAPDEADPFGTAARGQGKASLYE